MNTSNNFNVEQIVLMEWIDAVTEYFLINENQVPKFKEHYKSKSITLQNLLKKSDLKKKL